MMKAIDQAIAKAEAKIRKRKDEEMEAKELARAYAELLYAREKKTRHTKLALIKKAAGWAKKFAASKQFRRLRAMSICPENFSLVIYSDGWGHGSNEMREALGCYSDVAVESDGVLKYSAGYKWMGGSARATISEDAPDALCLEYLQRLVGAIRSGEVHKSIAKVAEQLGETRG